MTTTAGREMRPLDEREMSAWHALIRAHNRVVRKLEAELEAEHRLTLPGYEVLAHLSEAPDEHLRMSELAQHAVLTPSGLTRLVDKLAREGLVRRDKCSADARVVYAVLTPQGRKRLEAAYPTHLRGVREHLIDLLTPVQQDALSDALGELSGICRAALAEAAAQDLESTQDRQSAQCEEAEAALAATPAPRTT